MHEGEEYEDERERKVTNEKKMEKQNRKHTACNAYGGDKRVMAGNGGTGWTSFESCAYSCRNV